MQDSVGGPSPELARGVVCWLLRISVLKRRRRGRSQILYRSISTSGRWRYNCSRCRILLCFRTDTLSSSYKPAHQARGGLSLSANLEVLLDQLKMLRVVLADGGDHRTEGLASISIPGWSHLILQLLIIEFVGDQVRQVQVRLFPVVAHLRQRKLFVHFACLLIGLVT